MFMSLKNMNISIPKLKAMLLFFCAYTRPNFLGKTKLMKLFYFADFLHVKKFGSPITYARYINLDHGPIPSAILNLVNSAGEDIDNSVLADTISIEKANDYDMYRIRPLRKFTEEDKKYFTDTELKILDNVCIRFGDVNTKTIEDESHKEAPWRLTHLGEEIPYSLATEDRDCLVDKEEIELLMKISKHY